MLHLNGFLLSYLKYGDNDCVLHCFTGEKGYQSLFVKGVYGKKSKRKAYLHPLAELSFTMYKNPVAGSMLPVSRLEPVQGSQVPHNIKANSVIFFMADFLNQVLRNEGVNPGIYAETAHFLEELNGNNFRAHLIFMVRFLEISGVQPLVGPGAFLDPESGSFTENKVHDLFDAELSAIWKEILSGSAPYTVAIAPQQRKAFMDSILVYYHYHFSDFRIPASLEIVQQLF
ncbi:DNA repair protein RecO [Kaistella sp. PBT33-4]|uniref:DNA repair protein RecO n=1 Tax=Kaistella sp. PBT33-4 TaxID=3032000 RepID=UPI0023D871BB|nr:DNA repair protein RecO [Kaistella sp. PBT33-4]MDF0719959.1 DNA repair protein RecO [Kaistella sp. PBT33-4]